MPRSPASSAESEVQLVLADDLLSRIVAQSMRQPGLSAVYTELLDFDGCEIYTTEQPELVGKSFGEAIFSYETSSLIGLCGRDGVVSLNPPMETMIEEGHEGDPDRRGRRRDRGQGARSAQRRPPGPPAPPAAVAPAERTLMLGWNRRGPMIALELSRYVAPGSLLTIAADTPELEQDYRGASSSPATICGSRCKRIDTSRRAEIEALDPTGYDHILVLGYSDHMAAQPADTRTLVTLLHLRRIAEEAGKPISVVSEMIDVRNRELAEVARIDDFVVSNKLVSLMLAQASENEHLEEIFKDLLDEEGLGNLPAPGGRLCRGRRDADLLRRRRGGAAARRGGDRPPSPGRGGRRRPPDGRDRHQPAARRADRLPGGGPDHRPRPRLEAARDAEIELEVRRHRG